MKPYKSRSGKESGVTGYETGKDFIMVKFRNGNLYKYSYSSTDKKNIEIMKQLAADQQGLATFISQHNPGFE